MVHSYNHCGISIPDITCDGISCAKLAGSLAVSKDFTGNIIFNAQSPTASEHCDCYLDDIWCLKA